MSRGGGDGQAGALGRLCGTDTLHIALRLAGNGIHSADGLHRVLPCRRFAGKHNGAGAVVNGIGHVGDLRTGGTGVLDHGIQHLGGSDHRLSGGHTLGNDTLLNGGDLRKVNLHAHIAPGHHDTVGHGQDIRQVADAFLIFDLGDDADLGVVLIQNVPDLPDIGGGTDKAGGNEIEALADAKKNILPVPLAHVRHGQGHARDVDALFVLHNAVIFHPAANLAGGGLQHRQPYQTVIQQDGVAGLHILGQIGIGNGAAGLVPGNIVGSQSEALAGFQVNRAVLKGPQPHLRPLGVQHSGHRQMKLLPQSCQRLQTALVLVIAAVGKVEPGHVHPRLNHLPQNTLAISGRAQGAYDFCLSHSFPFPLCVENQKIRPPAGRWGTQGGADGSALRMPCRRSPERPRSCGSPAP